MAKILIVEDNALNIKLFCDLLAAHGHEPEAVTDSRNALDAARSFSPDLVITDIQLPHVSGLDLIRLIRKDEELAEIPIMAVTAYSAQRATRSGSARPARRPMCRSRSRSCDSRETVDQLLETERASADRRGADRSRRTNSDDGPGPGEAGGEEELETIASGTTPP